FDAYGNIVATELRNASNEIVTAGQEGALLELPGFTARPFDAYTGLQNNLHRWYDLSTGWWMSEDPIAHVGVYAMCSRPRAGFQFTLAALILVVTLCAIGLSLAATLPADVVVFLAIGFAFGVDSWRRRRLRQAGMSTKKDYRVLERLVGTAAALFVGGVIGIAGTVAYYNLTGVSLDILFWAKVGATVGAALGIIFPRVFVNIGVLLLP
ncbi:MAG: hypothetical protein JXB62_22070, partial [Pirellulales bacterium]|nr:hypothetical protein [Pirellulales bacterium]